MTPSLTSLDLLATLQVAHLTPRAVATLLLFWTCCTKLSAAEAPANAPVQLDALVAEARELKEKKAMARALTVPEGRAALQGDIVVHETALHRRLSEVAKSGTDNPRQYAAQLLATRMSVNLGSPPPEDEMKDNHGKKLRFEDLKGKTVLVLFTGSWCAPCQAIKPILNQLHAEQDGQSYAMVVIHQDQILKVKPMKEEGTPPCYDFVDTDGSLCKAWAVYTFPAACIIDASGKIATDWRNGASARVRDGRLRAALVDALNFER